MPTAALAAGLINAAVYTSPHATPDLDPEPALLAVLRSAKKSLLFGVYSLTLPDVAAAIIDAHQRGVTVRGVMDRTQYAAATSLGPQLLAAGVDLRVWGSRYLLMHDKVAVVDGTTVALGSFNWSRSAEKGNVEVMLVAHGVQVRRVLAPVLTAQLTAAYIAGNTPTAALTAGIDPQRLDRAELAHLLALKAVEQVGYWTGPLPDPYLDGDVDFRILADATLAAIADHHRTDHV